jgi:hypothetical protein
MADLYKCSGTQEIAADSNMFPSAVFAFLVIACASVSGFIPQDHDSCKYRDYFTTHIQDLKN